MPACTHLLVATESALNSSGEPEDFGGVLYYVHWDGAKPEAQELMSATTSIRDPRLGGITVALLPYFNYNNGVCPPMGTGVCGIFALDSQTGKVEQLLGDSTEGLAVSPDGSLLAFWDYTTGDKLDGFQFEDQDNRQDMGGRSPWRRRFSCQRHGILGGREVRSCLDVCAKEVSAEAI
jgi:hypothetical protein